MLYRCHDAVTTALSLAGDAEPPEQTLIGCLAKRIQHPHGTDREVLNAWHREYAERRARRLVGRGYLSRSTKRLQKYSAAPSMVSTGSSRWTKMRAMPSGSRKSA